MHLVGFTIETHSKHFFYSDTEPEDDSSGPKQVAHRKRNVIQ
jgi:hypothetical protein